jgi:hypothetical protein
VIHPRTGEPAVPRIPGLKFLDNTGDGRQPLAEWMTGSDNPYFARSIVNRLWKEMMGRGLVEPVDDMRETSPATHPGLLGKLPHAAPDRPVRHVSTKQCRFGNESGG